MTQIFCNVGTTENQSFEFSEAKREEQNYYAISEGLALIRSFLSYLRGGDSIGLKMEHENLSLSSFRQSLADQELKLESAINSFLKFIIHFFRRGYAQKK